MPQNRHTLRMLTLALAAATAIPLHASAALAGQHGAVGHPAPGYLGVDLREITEDHVVTLKLKDVHGAEIVRVDHDGPAGKMNLRDHDVILQLNGVVVESLEQARRLLHDMPPGRPVALLISRDGQQIAVSSQMADRSELEREAWELHLTPPAGSTGPVQAPLSDPPSSDSGFSAAPAGSASASRYSRSFLGSLLPNPTYTGLLLEKMSTQLAGYFGVNTGTGLLVRSVAENSPAAMAGVRAGDVVVRADQQNVATPAAWGKAIREAKGRPVSVVVVRDRQEKTLTLTPDTRRRSAIDLRPSEAPETATLARLTES